MGQIRSPKEKFLTLTGLGYPAQASRDHAEHEFYAKRTLYAYMPCAGLRGTDYIDDVVERFFDNRYSALLRAFVEHPANIWCPTWVQQNYKVRNPDPTLEQPVLLHTKITEEKDTSETPKDYKKTSAHRG